eukprot:Phypoly_transcript_03691.p1 GENE.Phypoly_transcript_03691~~Phypoly_transcript_03691.p1  ORF type:complete len:676 (+),score=167.75 Phypoly_transcript_03691:77-2029(+)
MNEPQESCIKQAATEHVAAPSREAASETCTVRKYIPRRVLEASAEASSEDVFLRKLKGYFNKMCINNSDAQVDQIVDALQEISTNSLPSTIWNCIAKFILQRAIAEPNFHPVYVGLCSKIVAKYPCAIPDPSGGLKFGDLFPPAYECELQQRLSVENPDADLMERMKEKMLNGTRFVGEIGKKPKLFAKTSSLLSPVSLLLAFLDDPKFQGTFTGINSMCVECACTLLNLSGKTVDMPPTEATDKIFEKIQALGENKSLVPRLRFMAKDLAELRANRWLPRVLTKKSDEIPTIPIGPPPSSLPAPLPAASHENPPQVIVSPPSTPKTELPSGGAGMNGRHKETESKDMSMEDAELFSAMENFMQKLNGKSESCVANVMRKFVKSIPTDQAKILATVFGENPDLACLAQPLPSPRSDKIFSIRRSSSGVLAKSPSSPQPLSRNFHAIINLIKLNSAATYSDEINQALVTKVSTLQASELIEVVGSIFRKMCETPDEYPYCLNICIALADTKTSSMTFQETLETCCQDETALKMFNTQAALNTYLQLLKDLEQKLHMDMQIVKKCVGNVQNGLYELNEQEASLLASLEHIVTPISTPSSTPTTPSSSSLSLSFIPSSDSSEESTARTDEEQGERKGRPHSRSAEGACWSRRC